jgi:hypothetical protein
MVPVRVEPRLDDLAAWKMNVVPRVVQFLDRRVADIGPAALGTGIPAQCLGEHRFEFGQPWERFFLLL